MQLVEQHVISKRDPRYSIIDEAAFKSKNLYNAALYLVRQSYIREGKYLNYHEVQRRICETSVQRVEFRPEPVAPRAHRVGEIDHLDRCRHCRGIPSLRAKGANLALGVPHS